MSPNNALDTSNMSELELAAAKGETPEVTGGDSTKAWANTATLASDGSLNKGIALSSAFPKPGVYTLQFKVILPQGFPYSAPVVEALITWSVRGQAFTRRCSVTNGVSIQGNAEGISVQLFDFTGGTSPVVNYQIVMTVVEGTRATTPRPVILSQAADQFTVLATSSSAAIPIPEDAGAIAVYAAVFASAGPMPENSIQMKQLDSIGPVVLQQDDPRVFQWVPLAPGANEIIMQNANAFAVNVRLYFAIDG